jgi:hypothetical protein
VTITLIPGLKKISMPGTGSKPGFLQMVEGQFLRVSRGGGLAPTYIDHDGEVQGCRITRSSICSEDYIPVNRWQCLKQSIAWLSTKLDTNIRLLRWLLGWGVGATHPDIYCLGVAPDMCKTKCHFWLPHVVQCQHWVSIYGYNSKAFALLFR